MANKIKSSMRIKQIQDGITCIVTRYISGHGRVFHQITESSQGRIERMLNTTNHSIYIELVGGIILGYLSYEKESAQ